MGIAHRDVQHGHVGFSLAGNDSIGRHNHGAHQRSPQVLLVPELHQPLLARVQVHGQQHPVLHRDLHRKGLQVPPPVARRLRATVARPLALLVHECHHCRALKCGSFLIQNFFSVLILVIVPVHVGCQRLCPLDSRIGSESATA